MGELTGGGSINGRQTHALASPRGVAVDRSGMRQDRKLADRQEADLHWLGLSSGPFSTLPDLGGVRLEIAPGKDTYRGCPFEDLLNVRRALSFPIRELKLP